MYVVSKKKYNILDYFYLQTDDTACTRNEGIICLNANISHGLGCKATKILKEGQCVLFDGASVGFENIVCFIL